MKRIPFLFILIMMVFTILVGLSCKKNSDNILVGKWELRKSVGGIVGTIDYPPGNGNYYDFKDHWKIDIYQNSALAKSGTYSYRWSNSDNAYKLKIETPEIFTTGFEIKNNQLTFLPSARCCDIATYIFEKIP